MAKSPTPPKTEKPNETVDPELEKLKAGVNETLFGSRKDNRTKPEETAAKAQPAADAVPTGEQPPTKPVEAPTKEPETPSKPPVKPKADTKPKADDDDRVSKVIRQTAEEVAREMRPPAREEAETTDTPVESALSADDQKDYRGFQKLEQLNPSRKGIAGRFVDFVGARAEYEDQWKKEHPDKEFNPDDEEHEGFWKKYAEFDSPETASELEDAKIELKIDERMERRFKPIEEERRLAEVRRQIQPKIAKEVVSRVHSLAKLVSPELAKKLVDDKGNFQMSEAIIRKLEDDFPVEIPILTELIEGKVDHRGQVIPQTSLINLLSVVEQIPYAQHTGFRLNPNDPVHARVLDYVTDFEKHMETAPPEVKFQSYKGANGQKVVKSFITNMDLVEMQNQILSSKISQKAKQRKMAELDDKYWTVGADALEDLMIDDISEQAKTQISRVENIAQRRAGKIPEKKTFSQPVTTPTAKPINDKPQPPSLQTADVVSTGETGLTPQKNLAESVGKKLFETS